VVTVLPGVRTTQAVRAIRFTRLTRLMPRALARWTVLAFASLTIAGRGGGFSATWTAPPPMIAPPQVQAQSFAKAIFTDIRRTLFQCCDADRIVVAKFRRPHRARARDAKE
jgi:hypothetical protein